MSAFINQIMLTDTTFHFSNVLLNGEININLININALEWFFIDSSYWLMQMLTNEPYCIVIPWKI